MFNRLLLSMLSLVMLCSCEKQGPEIYIVNAGRQYLVLQPHILDYPEVLETNIDARSKVTAKRLRSSLDVVSTMIVGDGTSNTVTMHFSKIPNTQDYALERHVSRWNDSPPREQTYTPAQPMLHRLDDPAVITYYRGALALESRAPTSETSETLLAVAAKLIQEHPADLHCRLVYLDAIIRKADATSLREHISKWEHDFAASSDRQLQIQFSRARNAQLRFQLDATGRNGEALHRAIFANDANLQRRLELLAELFQYQEALAAEPLVIANTGMPNFLERQVLVKVARQISYLYMVQGKRQEALRLLASSYRLGQHMNSEFGLISRMIGYALRSISSAGLKDFALTACETEQEFRNLWAVLDELEQVDRLPQRRSVNEGDSFIGSASGVEHKTRESVADANFEILRMVTAAKLHQILTGKFPASDREFTPLLPAGPPPDPFTSNPLQLAADGVYRCYSFGPDTKDDSGKIIYDATNGTISTGDIVTTISPFRIYPFPRDGVRANTRNDVLQLFPSGLPVDVFYDRGGQGMHVTNSTPLKIYSVGPDTDSSRIEPMVDTYVPTIQYDPTNGTVSAGDLFIELPRR